MWFPADELAKTEEACRREGLLARTRLALLKIEKVRHREGWDANPILYRFERPPGRDYVRVYPSGLTETLLQLTHRTGGDVGEALGRLADGMRWVRGLMGAVCSIPINEDLMQGELRGDAIYGYAMASEAWSTPGRDGQSADDIARYEAAGRAKTIDQLPDRREVRMVTLVCRDGLVWTAIRERGNPPCEVVCTRPEADFEWAGLVPNGLGRMTAAVVGNPAPVPSTGEDRLAQRERRA